ncbi:MAG: hypothetical protein ACJ79K_16940 [Gemmatimonadaceae bacterium]
MRATLIGMLVATALAVSCRSRPTPVPVAASAADLGRLAGEWTGSYDGNATGRSGSIVFRLRAGSDTAFGDVVMVPRPLNIAGADRAPTARRADPAQALTIHFVRISGDTVRGRLDPYRDPDSGEMVVTTFTGWLRDVRTFAGTFVTTAGNGATQGGRWKVTR